MVAAGEEAGFEELRAESVERRGKAFTRSSRRKERSFAKWGERVWFRIYTTAVDVGESGRYSFGNIDTLLATLAKPVAAQIAAGRASGAVAVCRVDGIHHASKTGETEVGFSMQSPDGGQATHW